MKSFILVNAGLEELALKEVFELIKVKGKISGSGVIEFEAKKEELVKLVFCGQSFRKVLVGLGKNTVLSKVDFSKVEWGDYFSEGFSFKVEVEGVEGNEKRLKIGKQMGSKVFLAVKKKLGAELKFDMKKPDIVVLVYYGSKNYFIGVDVCGCELDKRSYRVFVNQASLKGDLAYYLVRKSGFVKGERLVVGFVRDGTVLIEAGLFSFGLKVNREEFAFKKWPLFRSFKDPTVQKNPRPPTPKIIGFDENMMSIRAARKNAKIAGVAELIELNKFDLDELDVKFSKGKIDRLILQVTRKDEDKLNEIYYQASYVLKKKGTLLIMGRNSWEISVSGKFKLISEEEVKRGGSTWKVWLMEKK